MNRRSFLAFGAAGTAGLFHATRAHAQGRARSGAPPVAVPAGPTGDEIPYGETRMKLDDDDRQGTVYVPKAYKHGSPRPILMMLHGFNGSADSARRMQPLAEELGMVLVAPESRDLTWGQSAPGFDPDSKYLGAALRAVTGYLDVDRKHVAIGGISDGATYAFSMGLAYGDVFSHVVIFSEGIPIPYRKQGKPKIFIGHGINDVQMPIDRTSRRFVPQLRSEGYDITYREYEGGHGPPMAIIREGFTWFAGEPAAKP